MAVDYQQTTKASLTISIIHMQYFKNYNDKPFAEETSLNMELLV